MRVRDIPTELRQKGFTTRDMSGAPLGALYIWPVSNSIDYAKALARKLGREDLEIVPGSVLEQDGIRLRGRRLSAIILDHACAPSIEEYDVLEDLRARCLDR